MKKTITILALVLLLLTSCTDGDRATRILSEQGYSEISLTGYRIFGCSEDDTFRDGFSAMSATKKKVQGVVCSGWLKGSTIRID